MKFNFKFIPLFVLTAVLYGCPPTNTQSDLSKVQDNNMDFPELREQFYKGLYFKLSNLFQDDYNTEYVIQDDAQTMSIYDMDVKFSIEVFSNEEAQLIQYTFEEEIDPLNAVHDNYVFKRLETLEEGRASIKKSSPSCKFPCLVQVIHGTSSIYGEASSYFMATVEADNQYYVIHLIGVEKHMGYLFDDFEAILASLRL
jgi:hypothetical protein